MKKTLGILVATVAAAGALTALSGGGAQAASSGELSAQSASRTSIACKAPKGARSNYSWADGDISVTVYFNNHCSHRVYATLHINNPVANYRECFVTNGGTKGKKKFNIGAASTLTRITSGC
ncbi:hypothetical protein [Nonomuraea sp. SBT364]|uniref:hypothetical protein n=1 Tax=Nonomuraea sp. SBT364 TaxID=1580530 RepID=UPI00066D5E3B|nr:hypothetical protein [Nonomuraea sp. SBT364]